MLPLNLKEKSKIPGIVSTAILLICGANFFPQNALAESPTITWTDVPSLPAHISEPVARSITWECNDPSDEFPLSLGSRVYDVTTTLDLTLLSPLVETNHGSFDTDPVSMQNTYDVPLASLVSGKRYAYSAHCADSSASPGAYSAYAYLWFVYDSVNPALALTSNPGTFSTNPDADFSFTCDDDSFSYASLFSPAPYVPACSLQCALFDAVGDTEIVAPGTCDITSVEASTTVATQSFTGLPPGHYRFEVQGSDGAGNLSTILSHTWEIGVAPQCNDGLDNDGDGATDYPDDLQCSSADDIYEGDNSPPSAPELLGPSDGTADIDPTAVEFSWRHATDPDGDLLSYTITYCTDASFTSCTPLEVATVRTNLPVSIAAITGLSSILLLGMTGLSLQRRKIALVAAFLLVATLLSSCSGGGSSSPPPTNLTYQANGLSSGVTYYWKVNANDGKDGSTDSPVWSFSTQ